MSRLGSTGWVKTILLTLCRLKSTKDYNNFPLHELTCNNPQYLKYWKMYCEENRAFVHDLVYKILTYIVFCPFSFESLFRVSESALSAGSVSGKVLPLDRENSVAVLLVTTSSFLDIALSTVEKSEG